MKKDQAGPGSGAGMTGEAECPTWVAHFLAGLIVTGSVREAVAEAGIDFDTAWALREAEPAFAFYWDKGLRAHREIMAGVPYWEAVADDDEWTVH